MDSLRSGHALTMDSLRSLISGYVHTVDSIEIWSCTYHGLTWDLIMYVPWTHWDLVIYLSWTQLRSDHSVEYVPWPHWDLVMYTPWTHFRFVWVRIMGSLIFGSSMYHILTEIWSNTYHGLTEIWDSRILRRVRTISWLTWDLTTYIGPCPHMIYVPWMSSQVIVAPEAIVVTG